MANAACGCLVQVIEDRRPALIKQADLLVEDQPSAEIPFPQTFMGSVWVGVDGMCAYALFGYTDFGDVQLVLMDFDVLPWTGTLLDDIARRLDTLCEEAFANTSGAVIEVSTRYCIHRVSYIGPPSRPCTMRLRFACSARTRAAGHRAGGDR